MTKSSTENQKREQEQSSQRSEINDTATALTERSGNVLPSAQSDSTEKVNEENYTTASKVSLDDTESCHNTELDPENLSGHFKADSSAIHCVTSGDVYIEGESLQLTEVQPGFTEMGTGKQLDGERKGQKIDNTNQTGKMDAKDYVSVSPPRDFEEVKENELMGNHLDEVDVNLSAHSMEDLQSESSKSLFESEGEHENSQYREDGDSLSSRDTEACAVSYESAGQSEESEPLSLGRFQVQDASSFLVDNPWMVPGLAAQVAKISQEHVQLSEDTFGDPDSDDE